MLFSATEGLAGNCPQEKLFSFHKVKESKPLLSVDRSDDLGGVNIQLPLSNVDFIPDISGVINNQQFNSVIAVRKRLFRYTARATNLAASNLKITYLVNGDNTLRSMVDPSSRMSVTIMTRQLDISHKNKHTQFDAYIDLLIDYSSATAAGEYTGILEVTVECTQ